MTEIRIDPLGRKSLIAKSILQKPSDYRGELNFCPFCPENLHKENPKIIYENKSIKIIPNKYPASEHNYVIVHDKHDSSPESQEYMDEFSDVVNFFINFGEKLNKYAFIFKNSGPLSGGSIKHSHDQCFLTDQEYIKNPKDMKNYIEQELNSERKISENAFCPYTSIVPYETWIIINNLDKGSKSWKSVSPIFKAVKSAAKKTEEFNFNLIFYYSRKNLFKPFLCILPRFSVFGGAELGSGTFVNAISPEEASKKIKAFID